VVVLEPSDPVTQLRALATAAGIDADERLFSACIRCNIPAHPRNVEH
jgi:hypothetical protein